MKNLIIYFSYSIKQKVGNRFISLGSTDATILSFHKVIFYYHCRFHKIKLTWATCFIDMVHPVFDTGKNYKPLHLRRHVVAYAATHVHEVMVINHKFSFPLIKYLDF